MMTTHGNLVWSLWLLAIVLSFAIFEGIAFATGGTTLSRFMWTLGQKWPPILIVYGILLGGLAVHFWWQWNPVTGQGG